MEKEDIDQKFKKKKKYSRDQEDYRTNQVFKWQIRRAAMANGNNESLNRPHVESTSMPVIPSHHAGNSRGSKPGNGWKKVSPRKGPKPRQPWTRTHDGREGHAQYNHPLGIILLIFLLTITMNPLIGNTLTTMMDMTIELL